MKVENLGVISTKPGFCTEERLYPVGLRASYHEPTMGRFISEITDIEAGEAPAFVVSLVPKDAPAGEAPVRLASAGSMEGAWAAAAALQRVCKTAVDPKGKSGKPGGKCVVTCGYVAHLQSLVCSV